MPCYRWTDENHEQNASEQEEDRKLPAIKMSVFGIEELTPLDGAELHDTQRQKKQNQPFKARMKNDSRSNNNNNNNSNIAKIAPFALIQQERRKETTWKYHVESLSHWNADHELKIAIPIIV
jgi:hypothetical protein